MSDESPDVTAIILAGGIGSRLKGITDLPKPIVPVLGRPFLYYQLEMLKKAGIGRAVIGVGYRAELVIETMKKWNPGLDLDFSVETTRLGTGGAFRHAVQAVNTEMTLLMNGDSLCDFSLRTFLRFPGARGGIVVTEVPDCGRYGRVRMASDRRIERFEEKIPAGGAGWINAGIYLVPSAKLRELPVRNPLSMEHDVFPGWLPEGLYAFPVAAPFLDIGTPESYWQKEAFIRKMFPDLAPVREAGAFG